MASCCESVVCVSSNDRRIFCEAIPGDHEVPCFWWQELVVLSLSKPRAENDELFTC